VKVVIYSHSVPPRFEERSRPARPPHASTPGNLVPSGERKLSARAPG
jgi:hypothetical protein